MAVPRITRQPARAAAQPRGSVLTFSDDLAGSVRAAAGKSAGHSLTPEDVLDAARQAGASRAAASAARSDLAARLGLSPEALR